MARGCWIAGLLLIWVSVGVITLGTHLQTQSPRFGEFQQAAIAPLNPAGRMALMLSFTWQFACCFSGFFALLFTVGALCVRVAKRWHRELALVAAGAFVLGCLAGAVIGLGEAVRSFLWGFTTLGVGFLLSAAGLSVGGLGVVWSSVAPNHHGDG